MATIENFILRFKTEGTNALNAVQDQLAGIGSQAGAAGDALMAVGARLGPVGAAAGVAAAAFGALGLKAVNLADEISDLSAATGISASKILSFKQSLVDAGGNANDFAGILSKLRQGTEEAAGGNEKFQKAFETLGIFVRDANGQMRSGSDILSDLVSKFQAGEISGAKYAAAVDLLGKDINKLDLTKLRAVSDPFQDQQIQQLAKYREALDKLSLSVETGLLTAFGKLALKLDEINQKTEKYKKDLASKGMVLDYDPFRGAPYERKMTAKELKAYQDQLQAELMAPYRSRAGVGRDQPKPGGDYGAPSERALKEAADREERIFKSTQNAKRDIVLQFAQDEEDAARVRATFQVEEARKTIANAKELNAKILEIEAGRDLEIAKIQERAREKAAAEQKRLAEKLAAEVRRLNETAGTQITQYGAETKLLEDKVELQKELNLLSTIEGERRTKIFEADRDRSRLLALTTNLPQDMRLTREQEINAEYERRIALINKEADVRIARDQDFAAGFRESLRRYEESLTPLKRGEALANSIFSNMDGALRNFVDNGKFNFKDFANSVIRDLLLIELRASTVSLFKSVFGGLGTALGFRAGGGPVSAGQPYVVGERGAELFVPSTGGTIMSNAQLAGGGGMLGTSNVVYNIQAVDASSFKQLVARDPGFIYAVTEQGRKAVPTTRR